MRSRHKNIDLLNNAIKSFLLGKLIFAHVTSRHGFMAVYDNICLIHTILTQ